MNTSAQMSLTNEIFVDNFAGGGGASTGIELATGQPVSIAVNHDPDAIAMHETNHPFTEHYQESVWAIDPVEVCHGRPVALAWFSPDCRHFSRAKGKAPVSKQIRGLAWITLRWAAKVRPRVIMLENVPEFQTWGPVKRGKPIKSKQGQTFRKFIAQLTDLGYTVEYRELKACDYGAPTIRNRFFLVARCDGQPIRFPEAEYGAGKKPFRSAAECIDWTIPSKSIFGRDKPLAPNTLRRIARGLEKFTIKSRTPYIVPIGTDEAVSAPHISKFYGNIIGSSAEEPLSTVTAVDHNALTAGYLIQYHSETTKAEVRGQVLTEPIMTVDSSPRYALTTANLISYYSGDHSHAISSPLNTITTKDRHGLMETRIERINSGKDLKHWPEIRKMLNDYCGYQLADDEVLLLNINGVDYYIADISLRMLAPRELYRAQGFPNDYIIDHDKNGKSYNRTKQVARCGNAVPPPFAEALVRANLPEHCGEKITTMEALRERLAV